MSAENTNAGGGETIKLLSDALHEAVAMLEVDPEADAPGSDLYTWLRTTPRFALDAALSAQSTGSGGVAAEPVAWAYDMILRGIPNGVIATPQVSFTYPNSRIEFISNIRPLYEHPPVAGGEDADDLNGAPRKAPLVLPDEETAELAASERISAAQVAYDEAMEDYDPTDPEHEVQAFDAMRAAIAAADAFAAAPTSPAGGGETLQTDLRELLTILGMGDHARPQSPHEVFQHALSFLKGRLALADEAFATLRALYEAASEGAFVPEEPMDRADRLFSWERSFRADWLAEDE